MKIIPSRRYEIVQSSMLLLRAAAMLLSLWLIVATYSISESATSEQIVAALRAIFTLLFGISVGLWQDRWEHRHKRRSSVDD